MEETSLRPRCELTMILFILLIVFGCYIMTKEGLIC